MMKYLPALPPLRLESSLSAATNHLVLLAVMWGNHVKSVSRPAEWLYHAELAVKKFFPLNQAEACSP
jgi:hypothetical protein